MFGRARRHNVDMSRQHDGTTIALALQDASQIGSALEGAAFVGAGAPFIFGIERRPVGVPEIGREAQRFKALLKVKLTIALTGACLARIGFHDGRKGHDVAERLDNPSVRALLDRRCDRLF